MPSSEKSTDPGVPAVRGENIAGGDGVVGTGTRGVVGESETFQGVSGKSRDNAGVAGESANFVGIFGTTHSTFAGVFGTNDAGGAGVAGESKAGRGVHGISETGDGVFGTGARGVVGESETFQGVSGKSRDNAGVAGESNEFVGVFGTAHSSFAGVFGTNDAGGTGVAGESNTGVGVHGKGGTLAGLFEGNVEVTGDLILAGADYAEALTTTDPCVEAGNVVVLGTDGEVHPCERDYDTAVAGIVSGAGGVKPAIVLDRHQDSAHVALMGKVWCLADADTAPIRPGDLLTTSSKIGHCRRVTEPARAFGAVIGKALTSLVSGQGLVRVLVSPR